MDINEFIDQMIVYLPQLEAKKIHHIDEFGSMLATIFIEDDIMPEVLKILLENQDITKLKELFAFFEHVVAEGDENLINIFSITVLEIWGNDDNILAKAQTYMGPMSCMYQKKADRSLGRNI